MNAERFRRIMEIFEDARQRPEDERAVFLDKACAGEPGLRQEVESLLLHHGDSTETPDSPMTADAGASPLPPTATDGDPDSEGFVLRRSVEDHVSRVGPYKIVKVLGEGGMGTVYLAVQLTPVRRQVALKLIKLGMDTREIVARFDSERQALALMNHINIAKVHDAGATEDGRPYFVMEHVDGVPITDYCDDEQLSISQRLELFVHVCGGVQHAHQKAIIHRDLKPSNVLVMLQDGEPIAKIIDFGIAKATNRRLTERTLYTEPGQIIGTPEYMSPEQMGATALAVDTRTDIYSLGVLLYELLTGELPFDSKSLRQAGYAEIQRIIREDEPLKPSLRLSSRKVTLQVAAERRRTEPRRLVRQLRGDLDWITVKAMEKDADRRYATARELAADVERHLHGDPVLAGPPSVLYRLKKLVRKHRGRVAAVLALLLFAAAYAGGTSYLDYKRELGDTRILRKKAQKDLEAFLQLKTEVRDLKEKLKDASTRYEPWQPIWERTDESDALRGLSSVKEEADQRYNRAVSSLEQALRIAPPGSGELFAVKRALEDANWSRYEEALREGQVGLSPAFFKGMIESQGLGTYSQALEGGSRLELESTPAGAEVFCFRYEYREEHLVPLPFDPHAGASDTEAGLLGGPFLEVEALWDPNHTTFQVGDRLLEVAGQIVSLRGDLARALAGVGEDESVKVKLRRKGNETGVSWVPFPKKEKKGDIPPNPFPPGRLVDIYWQLGFTFAGYPLDFVDGCRLGVTPESRALRVELPKGSYLFVFRKEGYAEARVPALIPSDMKPGKVRLFEKAAVPEGYVHIPAGRFFRGGDREAYMSLEAGSAHVDDFFMSRLEVTFEEYLRFLNHSAVLSRIGSDGKAKPAVDWKRDELRGLEPDADEVQLVPELRGTLFCEPDEAGLWKLKDISGISLGRPVVCVPMLAGLEYARWLTEQNGRAWRFRLPRDLEGEKAARGVDRRLHVWGDHFVWSFCRSLEGSYGERRGAPDPVGIFPLDESVYGVRDMAGSVKEPMLTRFPGRLRFCIIRGGSWDDGDTRDFRVATRNRRLPERTYRFVGLRLVAEVPASAD